MTQNVKRLYAALVLEVVASVFMVINILEGSIIYNSLSFLFMSMFGFAGLIVFLEYKRRQKVDGITIEDV